MGDLDQELLSFVAANEVTLAQQAAALLQITDQDANDHLNELTGQGLISRAQLSSRLPAAYRLTRDGAELLDCGLPPLRALNMGRYRHEIGIPWVWSAARHGRLSQSREVLTRREMQAADSTLRTEAMLNTPGARFADQPDTGPQDARHAYPDLAIIQPNGGWVTIDILLTAPHPQRCRRMISRSHRSQLIRQQLYLVEQDHNIDQAIQDTASELGLSDQVHVQVLERDGIQGA